jgi:hypothetical protein
MLIPNLIQTLNTLDLSINRIGDNGAQYLAHAIRKSTVRETTFSSIAY